MTTRAQFIAGIVEQQTGKSDHVGAMLIGLDALPDKNSKGIRQRVLRPEMSVVHALDGGLRNWSSGWGERTILAGHTGIVRALAFSPDGARVLTGSRTTRRGCGPCSSLPRPLINNVRSAVPRCLTPLQREAFHVGTPPPRWCYERDLWPFADHGQPYSAGNSPPYGPPPHTLDERLLAAWDWIGSWFSRSSTDPP